MSWQKKSGLLFVAGALVAIIWPLAMAQQQQQDGQFDRTGGVTTVRPDQPRTDQEGQQDNGNDIFGAPGARDPRMQQPLGTQQMQVIRAEELIGTKATNQQGEDIGTIREVVLSQDRSEVSYVALAHGGTLGIGEKLVAIPWSAVQVTGKGDDLKVTMNITRQELDQTAGFSDDNWPQRGEQKFEGRNSRQRAGMEGQTDIFGTPDQRRDADKRKDEEKRRDDQMRRDRDRRRDPNDTTNDIMGTPGARDRQPSTDQGTTGQTGITGRTGQTGTTGIHGTPGARDQNNVQQRDWEGRIGRDRERTIGRMDDNNNDNNGIYGAPGQQRQRQEQMQHRRASELIGMNVVDMQNQDIADLDDIAFDTNSGRVIYGIVSFGGFWGIGQNLAAAPWDAITIQPRQNVARLDAERQTLEAISFSRGEWPNLSDPSYARNVYQQFGEEPDETIFGAPAGTLPGQQSQQQRGDHKVWMQDSEYNKNFKADSMQTVTGTIESVGTFRPERQASPGQRLSLKAQEGQTITVHLGPQQYMQNQSMRLNKGDQVTVTGSMTKVGWREVLIASEVKAQDRTIKLRDKKGKPQWSEQDLQGGMQQPQRPGMQDPQRPGTGQQDQTGQIGQTERGRGM